MCNLYSQTKSQDAMRHVFDEMVEEEEEFEDLVGNLPPMAGILPDYAALTIRHVASGGWQLNKARWGMPTPQAFLKGKRTDRGVANIRNVVSPLWRRWLGVENCCLVPSPAFLRLTAAPAHPATIRSGSRLARIAPWPTSQASAPNGPRCAS